MGRNRMTLKYLPIFHSKRTINHSLYKRCEYYWYVTSYNATCFLFTILLKHDNNSKTLAENV